MVVCCFTTMKVLSFEEVVTDQNIGIKRFKLVSFILFQRKRRNWSSWGPGQSEDGDIKDIEVAKKKYSAHTGNSAQ